MPHLEVPLPVAIVPPLYDVVLDPPLAWWMLPPADALLAAAPTPDPEL